MGVNYENKLPVSEPSFLKIKFFCSSQRNTMRSWEKFERGMRSRSKKWKRFDTYKINVCSSLKSVNFYFAEKLWAECVYLLSSLFCENSFIWFVQHIAVVVVFKKVINVLLLILELDCCKTWTGGHDWKTCKW